MRRIAKLFLKTNCKKIINEKIREKLRKSRVIGKWVMAKPPKYGRVPAAVTYHRPGRWRSVEKQYTMLDAYRAFPHDRGTVHTVSPVSRSCNFMHKPWLRWRTARKTKALVFPVFWIRDILVRIRIRIRIVLRILLFASMTFKTATNFSKKFFGFCFLKLHLHHFPKIKSHEQVTKQ